jgi:hypothetical protein
MLRVFIAEGVRAMASTFAIHARQHWTFQLVLHGGRTQLEGWCESPGEQETSLRCSAWLDPQQDPRSVAHDLMEHPSCALPQEPA